jgi:hypothetical protein
MAAPEGQGIKRDTAQADFEIHTNEHGGKQSRLPSRMEIVSPAGHGGARDISRTRRHNGSTVAPVRTHVLGVRSPFDVQRTVNIQDHRQSYGL